MDNNLVAQFSEFGAPEKVLSLVEVARPALQAGQIRVKMLAAPVNPADINFVQGVYGVKPCLPSGAGLEGYGQIIESQADDFNVGAHVIAIARVDSWAREVVDEAKKFLVIPQELDPLQAAMLKVNPLTALRVILDNPELEEGDWIVQNAANSGVGRCLIQIAKELGFKTINLVRREELIAELSQIGGDVVLLDDSDVVAKALQATGGVRPRLASNSVGGDSALRLMDMLAPGGTMVTYGAMSKKSIKVPNGFLIFKNIRLTGLWVTKWLEAAEPSEIEASYEQLADWMANGVLAQAVDKVYGLSRINEAVAHAQQESRGGKILLDLQA